MKMKIVFSTLAIAMVACVGSAQKLEPLEFQQAITETRTVQLLDVRTPGEFVKGHIERAINIDYRGDFDKGISTLNKRETVYVYCLSGGRSASAARKLTNAGFVNVIDLKGGIIAWKNAELPVVGAGAKKGTSRADYNKLINDDVPVLVDFYAPWCAPCRKMAPMLESLTSTYNGKFKLVKLNADDEDALMKELGVKEIPTFFVFKNGKQTWNHVGLVTKEELVKQLGL